MHPAISVIFFTVTSGAGFGAMTVIGLGFPLDGSRLRILILCLAACGLAVAGLIASTFHLGHPERAWRALSQWRSSWLSREGVAAIATLVLFFAYGLIWMTTGTRLAWLGALSATGAVFTVFATSMIYAQLKTVPQWNTGLTPAIYLGFSAATGWLVVAGLGDAEAPAPAGLALVVFAWVLKLAWWRQSARARLSDIGASPETATGLGFRGRVRLLESPHTGDNYLTREMVHRIGRKHAGTLRRLALLLGCVLPLGLLAAIVVLDAPSAFMLGPAGVMMAGLFLERWLFFAEAEHTVSLYYGHR